VSTKIPEGSSLEEIQQGRAQKDTRPLKDTAGEGHQGEHKDTGGEFPRRDTAGEGVDRYPTPERYSRGGGTSVSTKIPQGSSLEEIQQGRARKDTRPLKDTAGGGTSVSTKIPQGSSLLEIQQGRVQKDTRPLKDTSGGGHGLTHTGGTGVDRQGEGAKG